MNRSIRIQPLKNIHGRPTTVVAMHLPDGGWNGHYKFSADGMSPAEVQAKQDAIVAHHQAKAARLNGFRSIPQFQTIGKQAFEVRVSIREQGTDVRLILRVCPEGEAQIELDLVRPTVDALPTDAEISTMIAEAAAAWIADHQRAAVNVAAIESRLGLSVVEQDDPLVAPPVVGVVGVTVLP
jgi:predicted RNA-binding Zn ribbon-like protein